MSQDPLRSSFLEDGSAWGSYGIDGVSPYLTSTSRLASEFRGMDERPLQNSISLFETDPFYLYPQAHPIRSSHRRFASRSSAASCFLLFFLGRDEAAGAGSNAGAASLSPNKKAIG